MVSVLDLAGKLSIVTGAARGIGRAISLKLAEEGSNVTLCDLDEKGLKVAANKIGSLGRRSMTVKADISKSNDVERLVNKTNEEFGRIDILVNNAGVYQSMQDLPDASEEDWEKVFAVNYKGTFLCCRAVAPYMIEQKSGKIVNISSMSGRFGKRSVYTHHYGSSKAAVLLFTKAIARELAPYNINVNAICPGFVWTEMWRQVSNEIKKKDTSCRSLSVREVFDKYVKENIPLQRPQMPEDIANTVAFLCSDKSNNITGQVLDVDGGMDV